MSYLAFKERMNQLKTDEYERHRLTSHVQVYSVATFWILFTGTLLYYGHQKELRERSAQRPLTIPEAVAVSRDAIPMPSAHITQVKK